ncbi:hypothetical protein VTO42DRAFT_4995 [Malbranchea cinnamomea]
MTSNGDGPDYETDTFEDARDTTAHDSDVPTPTSATRTRSLTGRRLSNGSLTTPKATEAPPLPIRSPAKDNEEGNADIVTSPVSQLSDDSTTRKQKQTKSPLLTAHRLSTSSLDEINLSGPKDDEVDAAITGDKSPSNVDQTSTSPPALPPRDLKQGSFFQGFSPSLPSVPWGPPPVNKSLPQTPAPPPPPRKLTGPFSWLSRGASSQKENKPRGNRRNTGASVSTISSNPELLGRDGDAGSTDSKRQTRNSLKDQFRLLRLREEGATGDERSSVKSSLDESRPSVSGSPSSISEQQEAGGTPLSQPSVNGTSPLPPTVNPNLAPGTVAGISAAASDAATPVNWELWQDVVNHGPSALKGSNAEELNAAIKRGIPQTIRGVIWQVLADSRNPELEEVYRELVSRGSERDRYWSVNSSTSLIGQTNGNSKEKDSTTSSRSSVHSEQSTPTTTSITSPGSNGERDAETVVKAQAALEAVRKKKAKEEAAALQKLEKAIRRDLGSRTSYSRYFLSQRNQEGLFGVCKAYALYDEGVGYAQGINFIVMPLLFNLEDGEAFTLLVKLMNQYGLRNLFIQDMPGLHLHLYQFERLLEDLEPALYCHLRRRGVTPQIYATQWFLTLFAYRFPLQLVLRIYDLIFVYGLESTLLRFAVAIMRRNVDTLLAMDDMTALTTFLKEKLFDVYIDQQPSASSILESGFFGSSGPSDKEVYRADIMVDDACSVPLTQEMIKTYTAEWEEKIRVEKEQIAELEGLRHTVATQAARIRSLEEHAEKSDREHVELASELVRIKVEKEELKDANESLKVEIEELKAVIDRQPAEVEEKLRTEMDRIMKRNIEVQNENRSMEEQMAEMEKELVETKMKWAELSESHEALKQKWHDLKKAFDE